jgi:hypothetical protein
MTSSVAAGEARPAATIEVRIREVRQLFNSLDATPFPETDLDAEAEEFILGWAMEFRSDAQLRIRIHVEQLPADGMTATQVETALHSFFAYRTDVVRRRFRRLMARARLSLLIGLSCLAASVAGANLLGQFGESTLLSILRESLIIGGWVAMWGPLEILLYDWWPLRQERRVCERLSEAAVEIVAPRPAAPHVPEH